MLTLYHRVEKFELGIYYDNNLNRNVKKVNKMRIASANAITFCCVD